MRRFLLLFALWPAFAWGDCQQVQEADYFGFTQGKFTASTSTGNQTVDTGSDSVFKAIRFYGTAQTGEGFTPDTDPEIMFMGFGACSTGTAITAQKGIGWYAEDVVTTTNTARWSADSAIVILATGTPTMDGCATVDSFGTGGNAGNFYLTWQNAPAAAYNIYYEAYYGDALTNVNVKQYTLTAAVGATQAFTTVGFQPQFGIFMGTRQTARAGEAGGEVGTGWATGATQGRQAALSICQPDADGAGGTNASSWQSDTLCYAVKVTNGTALDNAWKFVSWDTDGFTLRARTKTTNSTLLFAMLFRGGNYFVDTLRAPVAGTPPIDSSRTGFGFRPSGVSFMSTWSASQNANIAEAKLTLGAGNDSLGTIDEQLAATINDNTRSVTGTRNVSTKSIGFHDVGSPPTVSVEADFKSFDSDGITITWSTITTTHHKVYYTAFGPGEAPATGGNIRRQRLKRAGFRLGELEDEKDRLDLRPACSVLGLDE